jgi:ribosomal-protein-serine acetyltransferase
MLSFHEIDSSLKLAKIGYWLDQDLQKNGIIYNSCKQFIQYGFENLKLEKIEISCATENMPSNAIAKKLKFKFNKMNPKSEWNYDHYKDINLYLMTKEDWHKLTS